MDEILKAITSNGLAFAILGGVLLSLQQGLIITRSHFEDYREQRNLLDAELRRELAEKDKEITSWQSLAQFGPQSTRQAMDIAREVLKGARTESSP